jgi:hypothetical protein
MIFLNSLYFPNRTASYLVEDKQIRLVKIDNCNGTFNNMHKAKRMKMGRFINKLRPVIARWKI